MKINDKYAQESIIAPVAGILDWDNSDFMDGVMKLPVVGYFKVTSRGNRLDWYSYKIYQDMQYWWILGWYNGITNYEDIPVGSTLKFFGLQDLLDLYNRTVKK